MLTHRGTWVIEELPEGRKEIGCQWTYDIKYGPKGEVLRHKARLVAQGFYQILGLDFGDTFSPTVCLKSLKIILHFAASQGWAQAQDDATGAFLQSYLDCKIYMRQPPGFTDSTKCPVRLVCSLYGLKQAARLWNKFMAQRLKSIGYSQFHLDNTVFI